MQAANNRTSIRRIAVLMAMAVCTAISTVQTADAASRFIVSLDEAYYPDDAQHVVEQFTRELNLPVQLIRTMSGRSLVISIDKSNYNQAKSKSANFNQQELQSRLRGLTGVIDVASDAAVHLTSAKPWTDTWVDTTVLTSADAVDLVVDDPRYAEQWQLHSPDQYHSSLGMPDAWNMTHGSADVVVAIVDTGIDFNHPDLNGRILPGYDFVTSLSTVVDAGISVPDDLEFMRSNDGDGRDRDATDPGDAVSELTMEQFKSLGIDCYVGNSSWHGTAMASIIAANVNDGIGIAGIDWNAKILPVRAIGKCGGHRSDMLDAIRWAAGVDDPTLPPNPTPARIINLSLGVDDLCTSTDQRAINDAIAAGAIVVAAVGNNGRNTDAEPSSPSHCQNVIGVMAVDKNGFRANYSNFGRDADVAAPGGDAAPSSYSILAATNNGTTIPSSDFGYRTATGTSVAAPHVAGVLALMLSIKPELSNRELEALLLDSTRSFPSRDERLVGDDLNCEKAYCGTGILDAFAAVQAVDAHELGIFLDSPSLAAAQSVPVSVGNYTGFGCTVSRRDSGDPMLLLLWFVSTLLIARRASSSKP